MIARVWKGITNKVKAKEFKLYMEKTGVVGCLKAEGNKGVLIFENMKNEITEFTFVSLWKTRDSVKNFSKSDTDIAVLYPEDEKYLIQYDSYVEIVDCSFFNGLDKTMIIDLQLPPHMII